MASPITTSTGLGSGLEIGKIVTALVDSEKAAKQNQITKETKKNDNSITAVGKIKSAMAAFQTAMDTLKSTSTPAFLGFAATSSNETLVKATANNSAVNGTYTIGVTSLATPSKVATASISTAQQSAIPSGILKVTQNGTDTNVTLKEGATLEETRNAINVALAGKGISANIINDSNGARLVFSSTTTGAGSDISVSGSGNVGSLLDIDGTKTMAQNTSGGVAGAGAITDLAKDAVFTIDGLTLTSKKNTVESAISGLTLDLQGASANGSTSTITVATNTDGLKNSVQTFVNAFNTLNTLINSLTKGSTDANGIFVPAELTGDSTPRALLTSIRDEVSRATKNTGLGSLAQLGVATQKDGSLSLNSTQFTAALNDKRLGGEIQTLFTSDTGLIARIAKATEPFTETGGVLALKTDSLARTKTRLDNEQSALDRRITSLTASLTKKYNAMDLVVAQLKASGSQITSFFDSLNAQKNAS